MSCVTIQFEKVESINLFGEELYSHWNVVVFNEDSSHTFEYESFDEMRKEWTPFEVIDSLKKYEIIDDFIESLKEGLGFYYPYEKHKMKWFRINENNLIE